MPLTLSAIKKLTQRLRVTEVLIYITLRLHDKYPTACDT